MTIESFLSLLQFSDGLFPTGAYAHSMGLEWYVQAGTLKNAQEARELVAGYLETTVKPTDAVMMLGARQSAESNNLKALLELDLRLDAMKAAAEQREASQQIGRQIARVAAALCRAPIIQRYFESIASGVTPGHQAIAFGVVGAALGWEPLRATEAYLYTSAVTMVSAAVKLIPLGQLEGQQILWSLHGLIADLANKVMDARPEDAWSFNPGLEIASMRHAKLEARLFRS